MDKLSDKRNEEREKMAKRVESLDDKFSNSDPIINALQDTDKIQTACFKLKIDASFTDGKGSAGCKVFSNATEISFDGAFRDPGALTEGGGIVTTTLRPDDLLTIELWGLELAGKVILDYDDVMALEQNTKTKISVVNLTDETSSTGDDKVVSLTTSPALSVTLLDMNNLLNKEMQELFYNRQGLKSAPGAKAVMGRGATMGGDVSRWGRSTNMRVDVKVIGAHISSKEQLKRCDPFCKLFWDGAQFGCTAPVRQSLAPVWTSHNEFSIDVQPQADSNLRVELWDSDYLTEDTLLGQMKLNSADVLSQSSKERKHELSGIVEGAPPAGHLTLSIQASQGKVSPRISS